MDNSWNTWGSSSNNADDDDDDWQLIQWAMVILFNPVAERLAGYILPLSCRNSMLSGRAYVHEVINGHPARVLENCRITVDNFMRLCDILVSGGYVPQNPQKRVLIEEVVCMTLVMLSHNHRMRCLAERFQHSPETICRNIHEVLRGLCELGKILIRPRGQNEVHPKIYTDRRFAQWFTNAVGTLDGTHVPAHPPLGQQAAYTNRHGQATQNVLAICDFDMRFSYIYAGWEGSAHDARVLDGALTGPTHFPMPPPGKYYLVDSAYRNVPRFLVPYRGTPRQPAQGRRGCSSPKQLFNTRHSSLRNVIERCFGVLKRRFTILRGPVPNFYMSTQINVVIACCTLHNFIRDELPDDDIFNDHEQEMDIEGEGGVPPMPEIQPLSASQEEVNEWHEMRDALANGMWNAYRSARRG
ncbi:uncharacterized protein LOC113780507 [Coffea eugenioides]|uniref:uncharacterized protein LOC113780507 n=1 Tax=Coffea eugenioides TaxID=49369 RepID=UPI000F604AB0|nr:uncharacterized protein LOC113780507 [Coffea eugenioides]